MAPTAQRLRFVARARDSLTGVTMSDAIVIVAARRTPIGAFQGALGSVTGPELGAVAAQAAITDSGVDVGQIDEVLLGCVLPAGVGQAPARQAALRAGVSVRRGRLVRPCSQRSCPPRALRRPLSGLRRHPRTRSDVCSSRRSGRPPMSISTRSTKPLPSSPWPPCRISTWIRAGRALGGDLPVREFGCRGVGRYGHLAAARSPATQSSLPRSRCHEYFVHWD